MGILGRKTQPEPTRPVFQAVVSLRLLVTFQPPLDGPHQFEAPTVEPEDDEHPTVFQRRRDTAHTEQHQAVSETRIGVARHAETEIVGEIVEAVSHLGTVEDVTVVEVAEAQG